MENTRAIVRQKFTDHIGTAEEFRVPEMTDLIVEEIRSDDALLDSFLAQHLRPLVYEVGLETLARWRREKSAEGIDVILLGEYGATRQRIERKTRIRRLLWLQRAEHAGDRHIRLRAMTKVELMTAGAERIERGAAELHYGQFLIEVANRLTDDERVADRFNDEQLEALFENLGTTEAATKSA